MDRTRSVCIAQINYTSRSIRDHLERLKGIIRRHRSADLLVLPELILHGHPSVETPEGFLYRKATVVYGEISSKLYEHIRSQDARVVFGQIRRKGDGMYNVATYVDRDSVQHYVKTHVHWSEHFVPGNKLVTFQTPLGPIGINVCFDAAFPEVWRALALKGPELIVNISAVPTEFPSAYMHRRMAGAALANQLFVVYANRAGPVFGGRSAVFDPRGERIATFGLKEEIHTVRLNLDEVEAWRQEEMVWAHRRPSLYKLVAQGHRQKPHGAVAHGRGLREAG
ncbi:MAG: hypothetical protein Kow0092_05860 [Deferrisomatales bacterium]